MDFKDQLIPGPLDTIITSHMNTEIDSVRTNDPSKIKFLYLNQIEVQNSTLVVDYRKDMYPLPEYNVSENGFSGITDQSLEYINIKNNNPNPYLEKGRKYNQWPTLDEEPRWMGQYPSKDPILDWNDSGIYEKDPPNKTKTEIEFKPPFDKDQNKRLCDATELGTRWSYDRESLQPQFWASNYTVNNTCGENYYLFDNSASLPGVFVGGGKR
jgi:hypothetical protein